MITHFSALDVWLKISQAQLCSFIRDCHATFLVKTTFFKEEVGWQPLKELQICSSSILDPPTRAFKWVTVCLSTIVNFEEISEMSRNVYYYHIRSIFLDIITYDFKRYDDRKTNKISSTPSLSNNQVNFCTKGHAIHHYHELSELISTM